MGSKERKERNRLNMHKDILHAAMSIVRKEGHRSLTLRKLADSIEYSATLVYLYFKNKEALLVDLAKLGYQQLNTSIDSNCKNIVDPRNRLKAMLTNYWHFVTHEKELFLLMQETEMQRDELAPLFPEMLVFINSISQATKQACGNENCTDTFLKRKCYTAIAMVQGFASLNLTHKYIDAHFRSQMLDEAIGCLIDSLN